MRRGFASGCKNIAVLEMAALKRLGYPHGIKISSVHSIFEDHALLKIELPEDGWKTYDVVPDAVPAPRPGLLRPIAEFDERRVTWFPQQPGFSGNSRRSLSVAEAEKPQR